jgi:hypothetical protein
MKTDRNDIILILCSVFLILTVFLSILVYCTIKLNKTQHKSFVKELALKNDTINMIGKNMDDVITILEPNLVDAFIWIDHYHIKYPDIALRQIQIESGNFTSYIAKVNNNVFGMRMPHNRKTTATCENHGFAVYDNFVQSIIDYKYYQDAIRVPDGLTNYQYAKFLENNHYWEDTTYINKLLR